MKPSSFCSVPAAAALVTALAGCSSSPSYDSATFDPYVYYSYYPAEVFYSTYYWTDPVYFYNLDGGSPTATGGGVGEVIRALARGEDLCPSHVTIAPRLVPNPCPANATGAIRGGVVMTFVDCDLPNGGTLNGTIEVETDRIASEEPCTEETYITMTHTTTITRLSYVGPSHRELFIPYQTGTGTTIYVINQRPDTATATLDGRLEVIDPDETLVADRTYTGYVTLTPHVDRSAYTLDGTLTLTDADNAGMTGLTAAGLTRASDCCHPTGGTLSATRSGAKNFDLHTWDFSHGCSGAAFDEHAVTMGPCP